MFECFPCGKREDADPVKTDSTGPVGWDTVNISGKVYLFCDSCLLRSGLYYPRLKSVKGRIFSFGDLSPLMQEMLKGKI